MLSEGANMAVKFFPARINGTCALCGKGYRALEMVGFYPAAQISHANCALYPEKVVQRAAPPLRMVKSEKLDAFKANVINALAPGVEPMPFQFEGAYRISQFGNKALLADEQGLGKTIQAILMLAKNPAARPAVIVVPSSVKINWRNEIKRWLPRKRRNKVYILNGRKPVALPETGIFVVNYDIVKYWLAELRKARPQVVICDESQYIKNPQAQRTKAIVGGSRGTSKDYLTDGVPYRLYLSGTPAENRPVELWPVLHNLRPDVFPRYIDFVNTYCAAYPSKYGLNVSGASNIADLAAKLRKTCMVRRLKSEVLPDLPDKRRVTISVDITNRPEYQFAHDDLIAWMKSQDQDITGALKAEALVRIGKLKQIAARGKLDAACEWVHDFLSSGKKLVVFAHHREIMDALIVEFEKFNPAVIRGGQDAREKQANTEKFQTDASCRIAICSINAARLGITLTAASDVATFEFGWTPGQHDQAEDRVHRIGQKNACMAYYFLADRTIDEKIAAIIDEKRVTLAGVLDQREVAAKENILDNLIAEVRKEIAA